MGSFTGNGTDAWTIPYSNDIIIKSDYNVNPEQIKYKSEIQSKIDKNDAAYDEAYKQSLESSWYGMKSSYDEESIAEENALNEKMTNLTEEKNQLQNDLNTMNDLNPDEPVPNEIVKKYGDQSSIIDSNRENEIAASLQTTNKDIINDNVNKENDSVVQQTPYSPFDLRLKRIIEKNKGEYIDDIPYSSVSEYSSIDGLMMNPKTLEENAKNDPNVAKIKKQLEEQRAALKNDPDFLGASAIMNPYAIIRLRGAEGSKYLLNQRNERKFYEVDGNGQNKLGYSLNPNTSSLISWGNDDPYQRTPYSFADFVFSKYWNVIPNNRLITLRRYAAPILDNLNFTGMEDSDSGKKVMFPPMATAITYFGDNTGNKLSEIMRFTSSYRWGETKSDVWKVDGEQLDAEKGPGSLFGGAVGQLAKGLAIYEGKFNFEASLNGGNLPPDPYENGPYENRIIGPVNSIDTVKKRERGIDFSMSNLKIVFEYVSRPIGGVNSKAAMLDILANFLVMGTSSAVFFGGAHRFMIKPAIYPFLGGDNALSKLYKGDLIGEGSASDVMIKKITNKIDNETLMTILNGAASLMGQSVSQMFSADTIKSLGLEKYVQQATGSVTKEGSALANNIEKAAIGYIMKNAQIPYLRGMRALLIGEPVGDWHLTIGNPLNPIALIGNLICKNIEVECNDELGPDDFPTEWKITVTLDHGMPRDKDAIESMFNRGGGRIYELPDGFKGSADRQTVVDKYTNIQGDGSFSYFGDTPITSQDKNYQPGETEMSVTTNKMAQNNASIWNKTNFRSISSNITNNFETATINTRSVHASVDWIAKMTK